MGNTGFLVQFAYGLLKRTMVLAMNADCILFRLYCLDGVLSIRLPKVMWDAMRMIPVN